MPIIYKEQYRRSQRKGVDITIQFTDEVGTIIHKTFHFNRAKPSIAEIEKRMAHAISNIEFKLNPLNDIEIEGVEDTREIIKSLVQYIRQNPDVTLATLITVAIKKYPDTNWKMDKLFKRIIEQTSKNITFTQFKNYAINKKFSGVDE